MNCQNQLDARDILAKLTVLAEISEFLFYRFWDALTFYTHDMFLLYEEILQQRANVSAPFFNFVKNAGYQTQREILNE